MNGRFVLLLASIGLVPIAFSYGVAPGQAIPHLLGFSVEGTSHTHVFRAIMGLYLANVALWLTGVFNASLRPAALLSLLVFMGGLAAGRILSLVLDGLPQPVLVFYLLAELFFAALAFRCLRASNYVEPREE